MRNPNGFGSVYRLSGNRRNPWAARKTIGWQPNGQPMYVFVGYYPTKADAMNAMAAYNLKPSDRRATFADIYDKWIVEIANRIKPKTLKEYKGIYERHLKPLYNMKVADIKLYDLQQIVNGISKPLGQCCRKVMSGVLKYAARHELIPTDRADLPNYLQFNNESDYTIERKVFTDDEIQNETSPIVLIMLYTGLRVGELLELQPEDIHLEERYFRVTRAKTKAGIRIVPIAERIVPLMSAIPIKVTYSTVHEYFKLRKHTPHDTRHTFISKLADLGVDERIIKAIVGHAGSGVTETVYTHINLQPMLEAVNRLWPCY